MAEIWVDAADGSRQTFVLSRGELIVGRDPQLGVVLSDAKVSRRHARLWLRGDAVWVEDLGSSNGTLKDGVPLTQATKLEHNSRIDIGPFTLQLAQAATELATRTPTYVLSSQQPQLVGDIELPQGEAGSSPATPLVIGRSPTCQVAIDDQSISRRHAHLVALADGVEVVDFGSSNGSFVAGKQIERAIVREGDTLRFGNLNFVLLRADAIGPPRDTPVDPKAQAKAAQAGEPVNEGRPPRTLALRQSAQRLAAKLFVRRLGVALATLALFFVMGLIAQRLGKVGSPVLSHPQEAGGHLMHAAMRALGAGPSSAERRRLDAIAAGKKAARELFAKQSAPAAEAAWRGVLDLDPCDEEALRGLYDARELQRGLSAYSLAEGELAQGNAREALVALASALDAPWPGPARAHAAPIAHGEQHAMLMRSVHKARESLAEAAGARGAQTCLDGQWDACLEQAAKAHAFSPNHPAAAALEGWVHDSLGEVLPAMAGRYPESALRQAMWAYAAGAEEGALVRVKPMLCTRCLQTHKALREQLQRRHQADAQQSSTEPEAALEQYESARSADAQLIPTTVPSVARLKLTRAMQDTYLALGQAAFARGSYGDALEAWQQGQALDAGYAPLEEAVAKLLVRAQQLLDAWRQTQKNNKSGFASGDRCLPLREVVAMTPVDAALHHTALSELEACRGNKGAKAAKTHVEREPSAPNKANIYGD